jgi:DNA polymerase-3 subunit delta'
MPDTLYPWHSVPWSQLHALTPCLPHALLFHGTPGTGKVDFALYFAKALLCEARQDDGASCGACLSCGWFTQHSHPDFRLVRPEIFDGEVSAESEDGVDAETKKTAKNSTKTPSKEIRIEQVRALSNFMNLSTHRSGKRVVVMYPAEALNNISANALLKTLEEPPRDTVILMCSNRVDRLLPTIISRCRKVPLPMPTRRQSLQWLQEQGVSDAEIWLDEQGGSPLSARSQSLTGDRKALDEFLSELATPDRDSALAVADRLQKVPVPELVAWLQRWLYDVFSCRLSGTIRYYPRYRKQIEKRAKLVQLDALLAALKSITHRKAIAEHPLSAKLFIEDMLLDYVRIFS